MISLNQININGGVLAVTPNQVRFIENTKIAQQMFGTPFGNVARNTVRDAITNVMDASVFKSFKITEHTNFQIRMTALNALNHFNFVTVDPALLDAGNSANGNGFGDPSLTNAGGRIVYVGGRFTF